MVRVCHAQIAQVQDTNINLIMKKCTDRLSFEPVFYGLRAHHHYSIDPRLHQVPIRHNTTDPPFPYRTGTTLPTRLDASKRCLNLSVATELSGSLLKIEDDIHQKIKLLGINLKCVVKFVLFQLLIPQYKIVIQFLMFILPMSNILKNKHQRQT